MITPYSPDGGPHAYDAANVAFMESLKQHGVTEPDAIFEAANGLVNLARRFVREPEVIQEYLAVT